VVVNKNVTLPHSAAVQVPAAADGQAVEVYQGEPGPLTRAEYLGTLNLARGSSAPVKLEFSVDTEGMLTITAASGTSQPQIMTLETIERPPRPEPVIEDTTSGELEEPTSADNPSGIKGLMGRLLGKK
jgi:hypothetical protein